MTLVNRIELKPIVADVARLNDWLDVALARSETHADIAADIKLCINEVVANLISYAFVESPDPSILVEVELGPTQAVAKVSDNGGYFDIREWPEPENPKALLSANIGGFGIALIRERASHIDYARCGDTNVLRITCSAAPI